jgi:hypothetical protein
MENIPTPLGKPIGHALSISVIVERGHNRSRLPEIVWQSPGRRSYRYCANFRFAISIPSRLRGTVVGPQPASRSRHAPRKSIYPALTVVAQVRCKSMPPSPEASQRSPMARGSGRSIGSWLIPEKPKGHAQQSASARRRIVQSLDAVSGTWFVIPLDGRVFEIAMHVLASVLTLFELGVCFTGGTSNWRHDCTKSTTIFSTPFSNDDGHRCLRTEPFREATHRNALIDGT